MHVWLLETFNSRSAIVLGEGKTANSGIYGGLTVIFTPLIGGVNDVSITADQVEELNLLSDQHTFDAWRDQIIALYFEGGPAPEGAFKRSLWQSGLTARGQTGRRIWTDRGLSLIEKELTRRGIVFKPHTSLYKHFTRSKVPRSEINLPSKRSKIRENR